MKLKAKFMASFMTFALIPILVFGFIIQNIIKNNTYTESKEDLQTQCNTSINSIKSTINFLTKISLDISSRDDINTYLTTTNSGKDDINAKNKILDRFKNDIQRYNDFNNIIVLNNKGIVVLDKDHSMIGKEASQLEYCIKVKETKKQVISKVKRSSADGTSIFMIATPILENSELKGIMLTSVSLNEISKNYIKNIKIGEKGYVYILDKEGTTIAHPKEQEVFTQDFLKVNKAKSILQSKRGIEECTYLGEKKLVAYNTDEELGWTFIASLPMKEVTGISDLTMKLMIIIISISAAVTLILSISLSNKISKPIAEVSSAMKKISNGDLTILLSPQGNDEIAEMSKKINETLHSLRNSMGGVQDNSLLVGESAYNLKSNAVQMATSANEVASAIQEIAKGTTDQSSELFQIASILNDFSKEIDLVQNNLLNVNNKTNESQCKAISGKDKIDTLVKSINSIIQSFNIVTTKIDGLSTTVSKIGNITDVINSISEQTNLLALNAAIEAARAGEQGKGFAVVADEVRKLAEESRYSSGEISTLVKSISTETTEVIATTENVKELLSNQKGIAQDTIQALNNIIDSIKNIMPVMNATNNSLNNAANSKDIINTKVQDISAVFEEISSSTEEISASTEELLASTEEVAELSGKMENASQDLQSKVNIFKIS